MMKKKIAVVVFLVLLIFATIGNFETLIWGYKATILGLVLSILFSLALIVLPIIFREEKLFLKFWAVFSFILLVVSVLGIMKNIEIITSDSLFLLTLLLTPFAGFGYLPDLLYSYAVTIVVTSVCFLLSLGVLFKKKIGHSAKEET